MSAVPASTTQPGRVYRYYDFVMVAFVTVLLCSNLIGAAKAVRGYCFSRSHTSSATC